MNKKVKNIIKLTLCSIAIIAAIIISINIKNGKILQTDLKIYDFFSKNIIYDKLTPVVKIITHIGSAKIVIILTILLLLFIKEMKNKVFVLADVIGAAGLNVILKHIIQRDRPNIHRLIKETGYSFPSGHAMMSMAFYGMLIYFIYRYVKNPVKKWVLIILLTIILLTIGITRIYLGVHYPSDVIGGFLVSFAYLLILTEIFKKIKLDEK